MPGEQMFLRLGPALLLQVQGALVVLKRRTRRRRNGLLRDGDFLKRGFFEAGVFLKLGIF
jgi:hypothetical protein